MEESTEKQRNKERGLKILSSDVNKHWTCKDKDKDFTYSYLLQVAPTIAVKQQQ